MSITRVYSHIDNPKRANKLISGKFSHASAGKNLFPSDIKCWIVSLEEKIEKSCERKYEKPKYSRGTSFTDDFLVVGFEHIIFFSFFEWFQSYRYANRRTGGFGFLWQESRRASG